MTTLDDRLKARLDRWLKLHPRASQDAIDRKIRSIAKRVTDDLDQEKRRAP
jgi:hypothetical protein